VPPAERRKDQRLGLSIPVRVNGHDKDSKPWEEMAATQDASYGGASFPLRHACTVGQVLQLSLPLPRNFRHYDLTDASYRTFALIRNLRMVEGEVPLVGVMFLGRNAPKGYDRNPGGRFRLTADPRAEAGEAGERRRYERMQIFVNLKVQKPGSPLTVEQTVTENLSPGGARVPTTLSVVKGEALVVSSLAGEGSTQAVVRNVYVGSDRVTRLNLEFPDLPAFDRLLSLAGAPPLPRREKP
jgi:hypothetical protein